jgi:hypothetical protein
MENQQQIWNTIGQSTSGRQRWKVPYFSRQQRCLYALCDAGSIVRISIILNVHFHRERFATCRAISYNVQRGPKVTFLVARSARPAIHDAHRIFCAANCAWHYAPDSRRMSASPPRIRRKCCVNLPREEHLTKEHLTRDVIFGPICRN